MKHERWQDNLRRDRGLYDQSGTLQRRPLIKASERARVRNWEEKILLGAAGIFAVGVTYLGFRALTDNVTDPIKKIDRPPVSVLSNQVTR